MKKVQKSTFEQQMKLLQTVVERQQDYIRAQNAHMSEKDETLSELRRQLFGTASEKIVSQEKSPDRLQGQMPVRSCTA